MIRAYFGSLAVLAVSGALLVWCSVPPSTTVWPAVVGFSALALAFMGFYLSLFALMLGGVAAHLAGAARGCR